MGDTLFQTGALVIEQRQTPQGPRLDMAIDGALNARMGATSLSRDEVVLLVRSLRDWIHRT